MKVSFLEWDSNFFNRAVGKIDIEENEAVDIEEAIENCKKQQYKMLYMFVNSRNTEMITKATAIFGPAINEKVILEKIKFSQVPEHIIATDKYNIAHAVAITTGGHVYNRILDLTIKAGAFSRFKLDEKLDDDQFVKMYTVWVAALVNDNSYRIIIATSTDEKIIGFLSYKIIENGYKIDFMSVDESYKKIGIGKALLNKMLAEINKQNIKYIVTETHSANTGAYNFFISNGFTVKEAFEIYHVHL